MKPEDRDLACLWDMREFAREAHRLVARTPFEKLQGDTMRKLALERALEILGEAARRVSPGFQSGHPHMEWRALIGQRSILAHDYGEINHRRLYDTTCLKVPSLIAELDRILGEHET